MNQRAIGFNKEQLLKHYEHYYGVLRSNYLGPDGQISEADEAELVSRCQKKAVNAYNSVYTQNPLPESIFDQMDEWEKQETERQAHIERLESENAKLKKKRAQQTSVTQSRGRPAKRPPAPAKTAETE